MKSTSALEKFGFPGMTRQEALTTLCAHLFEPGLIPSFISFENAGIWCLEYVEKVLLGKAIEAETQYLEMENRIAPHLRRNSLVNPPFSIASSDGRLPSLPWRSPMHEKTLAGVITGRSRAADEFGEALQIAFVTAGGPGANKDDAIRVRAATQMARAFAEHWLMFFYKASCKKLFHATMVPDEDGRRFSLHKLEAGGGRQEFLFFETTRSWEREDDDFREFLREYQAAVLPGRPGGELAAPAERRYPRLSDSQKDAVLREFKRIQDEERAMNTKRGSNRYQP